MVRINSFICALLFTQLTHAEVLFEGYSKIIAGGNAVGYIISKYEFDAKSKKFLSTYFLKTAGNGTEVTESLKATASADLAPLSYEYTTIVGKDTKTIDAKFVGQKMTAKVKSGKKAQTIRKDLPKGTFLSTFLIYLMLKSPDGLKTNANYDYKAVAEEDAEVYDGQANVGKEEEFLGLKAFKIQNKFKDMRFTSYVNERGEVLGTTSTAQGISTELVADPASATSGFPLSAPILKQLFGEVPTGKSNMLSKSEGLNTPNPGKQIGIPPGQGIQLKPTASPKGNSK